MLWRGHATGHRDLLDHFQAAAPCGPLDHVLRACPHPRGCGFADSEVGERPRVGPRDAEVFGFAWVSDLELAAFEQRGAERTEMDVIDMRSGSEVDLCGTSVVARHAECPKKIVQIRIVAVSEKRFWGSSDIRWG